MEGSNKELVDMCHAGIGIYVRSYRVAGYEGERAVILSTNFRLSTYIVQDGVLVQ